MRSKSENKKTARDRRIKPMLTRFFLGGTLFIIFGFGLLTLFSNNGILDLIRLKSMYRSLQGENTDLLGQQEELRAEVERLKDPRYLEYLARERFGYMRPNEVFVVLDSPAEKPSPTQSPVDKQ